MGEHWTLSELNIQLANDEKTEASLFKHPDEGCDFSNGAQCINCPWEKCYEDIGRPQFKKEYIRRQGILL